MRGRPKAAEGDGVAEVDDGTVGKLHVFWKWSKNQIEWLAKGKKPVNPIVYNKAWSFQQYFLFKVNIIQ